MRSRDLKELLGWGGEHATPRRVHWYSVPSKCIALFLVLSFLSFVTAFVSFSHVCFSHERADRSTTERNGWEQKSCCDRDFAHWMQHDGKQKKPIQNKTNNNGWKRIGKAADRTRQPCMDELLWIDAGLMLLLFSAWQKRRHSLGGIEFVAIGRS